MDILEIKNVTYNYSNSSEKVLYFLIHVILMSYQIIN